MSSKSMSNFLSCVANNQTKQKQTDKLWGKNTLFGGGKYYLWISASGFCKGLINRRIIFS